jgi:PDZ domain
MAAPGTPSFSRETRLLLLTIAVSVGALLLLARYRFPDEPPTPPPQPLERLAARATFDELAASVERLDRIVAPLLVVLKTSALKAPAPRTLRALLDPSDPAGGPLSFVPALRVRRSAAMALLRPDQSVQGVLGDEAAVPLVLAHDAVRGLALVRVPDAPANSAWQWQALDPVTVPRYVVAVEASRGGSTLRPVFFGRADRFEGSRWRVPLLVLGHASASAPGSFVFSLDGQLVGLAVREAGVVALVPAAALQQAADRLFDEGSPHVTDFGIAVQPLGTADVMAHGLTSGLMIVGVEEGSLADGHLREGDLLQAVNGEPAVNADALLLQLAAVPPGRSVTFTVRRKAEALSIPITVPGPGGAGS